MCKKQQKNVPVAFKDPVIKPLTDPMRSSAGVSDGDLATFFSSLLNEDSNNLASSLRLNTGCKTSVGRPSDCSPQPLFGRLEARELQARPVYRKLMALYDNYLEDVTRVEDRTSQERREEADLLDEIMKSSTMKETIKFLRSKKLWTKSTNDFRKFLSELWFDNYSRGGRILGSSGFEHVFLGEKKRGVVQGFHNWVYFYYMEKLNKVVLYRAVIG